MTILADTSVWIAALVQPHPHHSRAFPWLTAARRGEHRLLVAMHSLAEIYAVLTTLPVHPRIRPDMARRLIRESVLSIAAPVELDAQDYLATLDALADQGISGGATYDALIVRGAIKSRADRLLTFNIKEFARIWPDGVDRIIAP